MVSSCRVIGTGSIGTRYLRLLADRSETPPRAVPAGGTFRDTDLYKIAVHEPYCMIERPVVDLTVIATRTGSHVHDFNTFGESSRRVLIEKPIAPSYPLAHGILSSSLVQFSAVSAPLRFMQGYEVVSTFIPLAGNILDVEVVCQSWLPDWRPHSNYRESYSVDPGDGGVLRDLVHEVDYSLQLFGSPRSVSACLEHSKELQIDAESSALMKWQYPDFVLTMTLDYTSRIERRYLEIRGESAVITWNVLDGTIKVQEANALKTELLHFPNDLAKDEVLVRQLEASVSVEKNKQLCTVHDALRAVALCDAARESDQTLQPVSLSGQPWAEA